MPAPQSTWVPSRGEIIFIDHSPAKGKEIPDNHPMLVASPMHFNQLTGTVIGFPLTHTKPHHDNPLAKVIKCRNKALNLPANLPTSYVLTFQPKSFDWRARTVKLHPWGSGYEDDLEKVLDIFDSICRNPDANSI
jgi:mRNA interferase MazF